MIFWQQLLTQLQQHKKVYLLTVIQNYGSSPGRKGFKMLVADDGFIFGSVGGGIMEFTLVEEVKEPSRASVKASPLDGGRSRFSVIAERSVSVRPDSERHT